MGKIFCLMGKSSSGKDTIFNHLKEDKDLNLKPIIGYTTRPKRDYEIEGLAYHFITEQELKQFELEHKVIEQRVYHTVNGPWYYATINDGNIDLTKNNYILIVTLEAYISLVQYYGKENSIPFYIEVEDAVRLERALEREKEQHNPNYEEMCRRFIADNNDFSKEKLQANGIYKAYPNVDLKTCIANIKNEIEKYL